MLAHPLTRLRGGARGGCFYGQRCLLLLCSGPVTSGDICVYENFCFDGEVFYFLENGGPLTLSSGQFWACTWSIWRCCRAAMWRILVISAARCPPPPPTPLCRASQGSSTRVHHPQPLVILAQ